MTAIVSIRGLSGWFTKLVLARETFIFYFLNQKRRNCRWVEKRLGCYQQEQFNLPRENSVFDSSQYIVNNRKFKMLRRRESQISNSLTKAKKNFCPCITLFVHFFAVNCTTTRENEACNQSCFVKDVNKQWQNSFSSWTWIWLIEIQLQKSSLAFDKVSELE